MKSSNLYLAGFFLLLTVGVLLLVRMERPQTPIYEYDPIIQTIEMPTPNYDALADYSERVMQHCRVKLSEGRRQVLAYQIARVVTESFKTAEHAQAFVALICIESKFTNDIKSSAGALGLTQIMPQYASEFAKQCNIGKIETADLQNEEVSLRLGACLFNSLLKQFNGNVALALSAYNSGAASNTTKKLTALGTGAEETSGYLAKHYVLSEKMRLP